MIRSVSLAAVLLLAAVAPVLAQQPAPPPSPNTALTLSTHADKILPRDQLEAELRDELTDTALKDIRARADRIAAALGTHVERYAELRVGNVSVPPMPVHFMAARVASSGAEPPPVAAAGDATVSVNVDATVLLAPV